MFHFSTSLLSSKLRECSFLFFSVCTSLRIKERKKRSLVELWRRSQKFVVQRLEQNYSFDFSGFDAGSNFFDAENPKINDKISTSINFCNR